MTHNIGHTYVPKQTNHLLHLVLTAITCGLWAPVWACVALYNAMTKDKYTTVTVGNPPGAWYGPVARPYEVGPGAPVSAHNPAPPVRPVGGPIPPVLRATGASVFTDGQLAFGPRCGQCTGCVNGFDRCFARDGFPDPPAPPQPS